VGARTSVQDNCVIHSGEAPVILEEDVTVGHGAIMEGCVIRRGAIIGINVTLGEAPVILEEDVTVGHGAIMEGCVIRRGAIIGINVTLLENTEIGEESLIAAGSVVVPHTKIPPRVLAAGSPAKVKKEISGETLHWIKMGSSTYVNLCRNYLGGDYKIIG